ncbi:hypothetical protein [Bradyrhizobium sp. LMTR 3]|uniref:hypothetical protein n=1 Tax=Bradyrhizobium sp. LMTR 3 TaxID=189873 RepID=UPI000810D233|nr:hypothetical protein [Bradyrhizobium sp. LMTR 3]OCK53624.1 hypothetical protein LMTR3_28445 [Bradyrhizobium sp. LMTR 3]
MASQSRRQAMAIFLGALCVGGLPPMWVDAAIAQVIEQSKTAGGFKVYLGVVPAEIVKGLGAAGKEPPMHGGIPEGAHEYHVVAAVFDAATGARVSDAVVTAEVSGLGLSGSRKKLEPMQIAGTTTYGGFFNLPGFDLYTVKLAIERGAASPAVLEFRYGHRR